MYLLTLPRPSALATLALITPRLASRTRGGSSESTGGPMALGVSPQLKMSSPQLKKSSPQLKLSSPQLRTSSPQLMSSSPQLKACSPRVGGSSPMARPRTRESTPESDQGYTSLASTSPDYSLAELVRAMQVHFLYLDFFYRVFFFTGHMKIFRVWENAIILMDFELVT